MGRVYERRGDFDRATNALKAAVFGTPGSFLLTFCWGRIYALKNDCTGAQSALAKALQADPNDPDAQALKRMIDEKCAKAPGAASTPSK